MKQYLPLLRNRNFLLLWMAGAISNIGDFFNSVALVKILSADPAHLGMMMALVMVAKVVPGILLGPVAGVIADRLSRRTIMVISDLVRAVLVLGLVFTETPALIVLLVFLAATVSTFFGPASGALLPNLVKKEELVTASSLQFMTGRTAQLLGNALGAVVLMLVGAHNVFLIDAASFLTSALLLAGMALPAVAVRPAAAPAGGKPEPASRLQHLVADLKETVAFLKEAPLVRGLLSLFGIAAVGDAAFSVLLVTFFTVSLGLAAEKMGFVWALFGGASVIGALTLGALGHKLHWRHLLNFGAIYVWMMTVGALVSQSLIPTVTFITLMGLGSAAVNVGAQAAVGLLVPNHVRGRIFGTFGMMQGIIYVISTLLAGFLSDRVGAGLILLVFTTTYLVAGLYGLYAFRHAERKEPEPAAAPEHSPGGDELVAPDGQSA